MASKSRAYTRPGADPEGRFRPVATPELVARGEELRRKLAPVSPSETVKSDAWYAGSRERERFPLAHVWIGIVAAVLAVTWLLTST